MMVRVEVPLPPVTLAGERLQVVAPRVDVKEQVRATLEEKPEVGATVMVAVPVWPLERVRALTEADRVNPGVADTRS